MVFKQSKEDTDKFIAKSNHSLSMRHALVSLLKVILPEMRITPDKSCSHNINAPSQRSRASFANPSPDKHISGLLNGRVNSCVSGKFLTVFKPVNMLNFSKEMCSSNLSYAFNRCNYIQVICHNFLNLVKQPFSNLIKLIIQKAQGFNILFHDKGIIFGSCPDRIFSKFNNLIGSNLNLPSPCFMSFKEKPDLLRGSKNLVWRGKCFNKGKKKLGKDINFIKQFREDEGKILLNLSFSSCDFARNTFSQPCKRNNIISIMWSKLIEVMAIFGDKLSNNTRINSISFSIAQRDSLRESFNKGRIKQINMQSLCIQEG